MGKYQGVMMILPLGDTRAYWNNVKLMHESATAYGFNGTNHPAEAAVSMRLRRKIVCSQKQIRGLRGSDEWAFCNAPAVYFPSHPGTRNEPILLV